MNNPIIHVDNISKKYRNKTVLRNVCFDVFPGDCIGIVGANGSGKSTLLRILSGADKPDCGLLEYNGINLLNKHKLFSDYIGYIPQDNPLFDNLTVADNLKLWYCETKRDFLKECEAGGALEVFGLMPYMKYEVSKLSGGMKKRLSIACSIAKNPPVLILDEPGASLDLVCKSDICRYLEKYRADGGTVIITSHEDKELALCTRMLLIKDTDINEIPVATPDELRELIK